MPKNQIQDIVPNGSRTIRNVPLPERNISEKKIVPNISSDVVDSSIHENENNGPKNHNNYDHIRSIRHEFEKNNIDYSKRSFNKGKFFIFLFAILIVGGLAMFVSNIFHSAVITVTPRTLIVPFNENIKDVYFNNIQIEEIGSQQVKAGGEKQVDTQASGTIIIYNNHSSASQRLIKNTRFETPEGLIYRIADSVDVPGKVGNTPGSIEAIVYADEVGEKYNVGLKDFTIPGFAGDPRFTTFYARSKTPLQGGFSGKIKVVADADMAKSQADIKSRTSASLLAKVKAGLKENEVLFDNGYSVNCSELPQENISDTQVLIKMNCSISAIVFDKEELGSRLAQEKINTYSGEPIIVRNIDEMRFSPTSNISSQSSKISFDLSGNALFEWLYDQSLIKNKFVDAKKSEFNNLMQEFSMIEKASVSIRPSWRMVFPDNIDKITIKKEQ